MIQRPGDESLVSVRLMIEPDVEALQRPSDRITTLMRFELWIRPIGG